MTRRKSPLPWLMRSTLGTQSPIVRSAQGRPIRNGRPGPVSRTARTSRPEQPTSWILAPATASSVEARKQPWPDKSSGSGARDKAPLRRAGERVDITNTISRELRGWQRRRARRRRASRDARAHRRSATHCAAICQRDVVRGVHLRFGARHEAACAHIGSIGSRTGTGESAAISQEVRRRVLHERG